DRAGPLAEEALKTHEQLYGPRHPRAANNLRQPASLAVARGDAAAGADLARRPLAIHREHPRARHAAVAETLAVRLPPLARARHGAGRTGCRGGRSRRRVARDPAGTVRRGTPARRRVDEQPGGPVPEAGPVRGIRGALPAGARHAPTAARQRAPARGADAAQLLRAAGLPRRVPAGCGSVTGSARALPAALR